MTHAPPTTGTAPPPPDAARFLRTVLRVDGLSTAVTGLALVAAAGPLGSATGMPVAFAVAFGVFQIGGAVALALIAGRPVIPPALVRAVVAVNGACAVACAAVAFGGFLPLTGSGVVFMLVGALVVAVYAALEYTGLRRAAAAPRTAPADLRASHRAG